MAAKKLIALRVEPDMETALKERAVLEKRTISAVIRNLIQKALDTFK